ncbi:hypothetical protein AA313_de0201185 [Arthrobotrys entomopaga]|nr:hypothetical protein AA313_de0201185 [Arthrobotrys entomopaga]
MFSFFSRIGAAVADASASLAAKLALVSKTPREPEEILEQDFDEKENSQYLKSIQQLVKQISPSLETIVISSLGNLIDPSLLSPIMTDVAAWVPAVLVGIYIADKVLNWLTKSQDQRNEVLGTDEPKPDPQSSKVTAHREQTLKKTRSEGDRLALSYKPMIPDDYEDEPLEIILRPPHVFQDDPSDFYNWSSYVHTYVLVNAGRFRGDVFFHILGWTKLNGMAYGTMNSIIEDVTRNPNSDNYKRFHAEQKGDVQKAEWAIGQMSVYFRDYYQITKWIKELSTYQRHTPAKDQLSWQDYITYAGEAEELWLATQQKPKGSNEKPNGSSQQRAQNFQPAGSNDQNPNRRNQWSPEDENLIRNNGWCLGCGWSNHLNKDCQNKSKPGGWNKVLTDKQKK